jgi:predicted O-methyltransferase YrrM
MQTSKFHVALSALTPVSEQHHPHVVQENAELFTAPDECGSTEVEALEFIHAFVRLTKPERVIETGTAFGWGTLAIASAMEQNGFGSVTTIDLGGATEARKRINDSGLDKHVSFVQQHSIEYINRYEGNAFDLGFFDSDLSCRADECYSLLRNSKLNGYALFHDTSRLRLASMDFNEKYINDLDNMTTYFGNVTGIEFKLSRGLRVFQV